MFQLSNEIYMLLVDATLDRDMPRGFYIFKLNLTQLFKMCFLLGSFFEIIIGYKELMRVYMYIFYVFYCLFLGCL